MSIERRQFLRHGIAAGAAMAAGIGRNQAQGTTLPRRHASDAIELGPDKVKLSRLAMGTGTSGFGGSSNQTRQLGVKGIADLLWFGYDNGVTFWDSADQYGSHPHLKAGLSNVPREKVAIMTKTHAKTSDEMKRDLDRFKKEIGTDYIDIVLLHAVREANWSEQRKGAMDYLSEMHEKGVVKTHGVSCHSLPALKTAAKTPWVHVDLARINPMGVAMDADPATVKEVLREMKRNGKGIIGMKILGEGKMRNRVDEMLAHALAMEFVDVFTIGAENALELGDLIRRIPEASQRGWPVAA
jgi:predicted aldo/keto reductase-like oxidoreductase